MRGDSHQHGFRLNADGHAPKRGEFAGRFGHGDDGSAIADTNYRAMLPAVADHIPAAESERIIHALWC